MKNKMSAFEKYYDFIENLKNKNIDREQVELCKKFIQVNWSNDKCLPGRAQTIHSHLAKGIVEHLFGKYVSSEAFILAADELGYENDVLDDNKNTWIKYRVYYEQNAFNPILER